jgi:hypothetical protein
MYEAYHPAAFSSIQTIDNQTRWKRTPARQLLQRSPFLFIQHHWSSNTHRIVPPIVRTMPEQ